MEICLSKASVGLVLSGGGAKGAYQAGVWKAFCECGVADRIRAISGTSVGAINGAAFALLRDPDAARVVWVNRVKEVMSPNFNLFDYSKIASAIADALLGQPFPFLGIFSRQGLSAILRDVITRPVAETGIDVYATALECHGDVLRTIDPTAYRLRRFHLNGERSVARIRKMILASASIPWGFDPVEIDGRRYVDGGFEENGGDNVPVDPILDNHPEIDTIYVVRCNSRRVEPETKTGLSGPRRKIIEIRPRNPLPGVFDGFNFADDPKFRIWSGTFSFLPEFTKKYFETGYSDGMTVLRDPLQDAELKW